MSAQSVSSPRIAFRRYALLALGIAGLAMAGVFYKLATAPVLTIVSYRMLMATALMLPLLWLSRRGSGAQRRATFGRSDFLATALSGALFSLDVCLWALSLQFTSVSSAALLVSMDPIFVATFGALFLRERPTGLMIAGMAVAACGAVIITTGDVRISGRALIGDALALSAAFAETGYLLLGRHVRQRVDTLRYATVVYAACALCVWVAAVILRVPSAITAHDLLVCLGLALVATVLGHTLVSRSLGHMPAVVVAVAFLSQPIMTATFAWLLLRQPIPVIRALGGSVALLGIGIVAYANERTVAEGPPAGI
ncbi:MAG TPA: DMT family transporter [Candidatus Eremiobacteraceae bacterium]|nr:DMT family transporter [Candidatus Eremiobacteraceae bacterium]